MMMASQMPCKIENGCGQVSVNRMTNMAVDTQIVSTEALPSRDDSVLPIDRCGMSIASSSLPITTKVTCR